MYGLLGTGDGRGEGEDERGEVPINISSLRSDL